MKRSRREYQAELRDLGTELAEADLNNDLAQQKTILQQIEWIVGEEKKLGNDIVRALKSHPGIEPARKAISIGVNRGIEQISKTLPELAEHLRTHINKGYYPEDTGNISWDTRSKK